MPKITKTHSDSCVRYAILERKDISDNMGATVISLDDSEVKN